jgi:bacillopeptidase F
MDAAKDVTGTFDAPAAPKTLRDNDPAVAYNGWFGVADAAADGGFYRVSDVKNDRATWRSPNATSITWVTRTGPAQGKASVLIDGVNKGTLDLYSASAGRSTKVFSGLANRAHTVVIEVLHTKNNTSSGYGVRLDALIAGGTTVQESDTAIDYDGWASTAEPNATDGTYRSATASTATVTVTFTGRTIEWITAKGKAYGEASVAIDGVNKGMVDLYRSATQWKFPVSFAGLSSGAHTMVIQVLGRKNASATGTRVVVDGFVVHT